MNQRRLLYRCDDAWKENLSFKFTQVLIVVRNILRVVHRHSCDECFPPVVLAWEAFPKVTLIAPQVASEASEVKSWTSVRDTIRSAPGASPPRLGGRTRRDECDACLGKGQTRSDQEGKTFGVTSVYTSI